MARAQEAASATASREMAGGRACCATFGLLAVGRRAERVTRTRMVPQVAWAEEDRDPLHLAGGRAVVLRPGAAGRATCTATAGRRSSRGLCGQEVAPPGCIYVSRPLVNVVFEC